MNRSTEQLVRWAAFSWLWVFAVLAGMAAGELVKKWPAPTGWDAPSQLAVQALSRFRMAEYSATADAVISAIQPEERIQTMA